MCYGMHMKWLERFGQYRINNNRTDDSIEGIADALNSYDCSSEGIFTPKLIASKTFSEDWSVLGETDLNTLINSPYAPGRSTIYIPDTDTENIFSE